MNRTTLAVTAVTTLMLALTGAAVHAADFGVSIQISEPGVYGRIDIGRFPQPRVVAEQPVIIIKPKARPPVTPVYLWVPPGHRNNWERHCGRYQACGVPVLFIDDRWYQSNVMTHAGTAHGHGHGEGKGHGKGHGKGQGKSQD